MSTKLYDGLIATIPLHDIRDLQNKIISFQTEIKTYAEKQTLKMFPKLTKETIKNLLHISKHMYPISIGFWALEDKYLAYPFYPQEDVLEYKKFIEEQPWISEYAYWNNSDKPDDITEEEWEKRRIDWEQIIQYNKTFGESLLIVDLIPKLWFPPNILKKSFSEDETS